MTTPSADQIARDAANWLARHIVGKDFAAKDETCRKCVAYLKELLAAERARTIAECAAWKPIETAPKDCIIDVWLGDADQTDIDFYCTPGTRRSCGWQWRDGKFRPLGGLPIPAVAVFVQPTHWQPLSAPPTNEALRALGEKP